jgi:hypothetical protein
MDLTKLTFEGYHFNGNVSSSCGSVFYDKDDELNSQYSDDWLEIIPLANVQGFYTVLTVEDSETVKAELYVDEQGKLVKCQ